MLVLTPRGLLTIGQESELHITAAYDLGWPLTPWPGWKKHHVGCGTKRSAVLLPTQRLVVLKGLFESAVVVRSIDYSQEFAKSSPECV